MSIGKQLKELRKTLNLKQYEFAEKIGSTQNSIANYETDKRNPSAAAINNICKTFNVNEDWLKTGQGEMFRQLAPEQEMKQYLEKMLSGESKEFKQRLLHVLSTLNENQWQALQNYLEEILASKQSKTEINLVSNFQKLDDYDKGQIMGTINQMLETEKYSAKEGLQEDLAG